MGAYLLQGGGCLGYILEHGAFTIPMVAQATGVDPNLVFSVVDKLNRDGVLWVRYRLSGQGRPANLYALYDASESQVLEAAALYRDSNTEHVRRLDDYAVHAYEETYRRVAEEAIMKHRDEYGVVKLRSVQEMLNALNMRGEDHRAGVHRTLLEMGYEVVS